MRNMKIILSLLLTGCIGNIYAQHDIKPTEQLTIEGAVKTPFMFQLKDAGNYPSKKIDSVRITNHLKQPRHTIKDLRVISVKDILAKVELTEASPKLLSEFYFVFTGSDNYKVVFSWNEIFNTVTGNNLYIVVDMDGKTGTAVADRIALLSPMDEATGRRFVKGLAKIVVKRVE